jgi:hypothetical protein
MSPQAIQAPAQRDERMRVPNNSRWLMQQPRSRAIIGTTAHFPHRELQKPPMLRHGPRSKRA